MGVYFNCTPGPLPIELLNEKSVCPRGHTEFTIAGSLDGSPELERLISIGQVKRLSFGDPEGETAPIVAEAAEKVVDMAQTEPLIDEKTTSDAPVGARPSKKRR